MLFFTFTHAAAAALGYFYLYREGTGVALIVNGEVANKARLASTLNLYRDQALRNLAIEMAVSQAAQRKKLSLSEQEANPAWADKLDPDLRKARLAQYRGELMFKKLIIADATEAEKRQLYETFKPQLTLYAVRCVRLPEGVDLARLDADLKRHRSMAEMERSYGKPREPASEELMTRESLRELVGRKDLGRALEAPPGTPIGPLPSLNGPILLEINGKKDAYEDLESSIEEIIFNARYRLYSVRLGADSFVSSPLASGTNPAKLIESTPAPQQSPGSFKIKDTGQPKELPKPGKLPTAAQPADLPAPKTTPAPKVPSLFEKTPTNVPSPASLPEVRSTPLAPVRHFVPTSSASPSPVP